MFCSYGRSSFRCGPGNARDAAGAARSLSQSLGVARDEEEEAADEEEIPSAAATGAGIDRRNACADFAARRRPCRLPLQEVLRSCSALSWRTNAEIASSETGAGWPEAQFAPARTGPSDTPAALAVSAPLSGESRDAGVRKNPAWLPRSSASAKRVSTMRPVFHFRARVPS